MAYLFGGDTGLTYEDLKRRQLYADQMMMQGSQGAPKTAMEGANRAAQSVMGALLSKRLGKQEQQGRSRADEAFQRAIGGAYGGQGSYSPPQNVPQLPQNNPEAIATDTMGALGKNPTAKSIREGLVARGLPEHVADGFLMNFQDESGLNPGINERNPTVPGSRGGFGLYQLTGPRRVAYEQYAQQRGVDPSDVNAQLDFLVAELQGPEARAAQQIMGTQDPGSAAAAIATHFLRPAEEHLQRRVARYTDGQQTAQNGGIDPAMLTLMSNEYLNDGQRSALGIIMRQQLEQSDPMRQLQMERAQLENEQLRNPQPDLTSTQREYEMARQQGFQGSFLDYQNALAEARRDQTNVNITNDMGTPMPGLSKLGEGMTYLYDEAGNVRVDEQGRPMAAPVAGTDTDLDRQAAERSRGEAQRQAARSAGVVFEDINRVQDIVGSSRLPVTGTVGSLTRRIPGTNAYDVSALTETIKANIGFDRLQQMREASPTGGALGQVTERELSTLQAVLGNLDQAQSQEQFTTNLQRLEDIYSGIMEKASAYPNASEFGFNGQSEPEQPAATEVPQGGWPIDNDPPPQGMDPQMWKYLSPEERAYFK